MTSSPANPAIAPKPSATMIWLPLHRLIVSESWLGAAAARHRWTAVLYEFLRFGIKQGWASLFGGIAVGLMIATWGLYPASASLARYDFLFLCMIGVQASLLALRLESFDEAKVILIYHAVGTLMEIFKTATGSWIYPEPNFFRIAGVPLFTGFMYSCIGSYICRAWRLFDFHFSHHPPRWSLVVLSLAIYANFFADHFGLDFRYALFAVAALMFFRTTVYFKIWRVDRSMPLLLGFVLVAFFIWLSENVGTFTRIWLYPAQHQAWSMVSINKLGSWFLLMIISYTLVCLINAPRNRTATADRTKERSHVSPLHNCRRRRIEDFLSRSRPQRRAKIAAAARLPEFGPYVSRSDSASLG
jgi:uncharacterized membrane protein YoaT (DUF817 family)